MESASTRPQNLRLNGIIKLGLVIGLAGLLGCRGGRSERPTSQDTRANASIHSCDMGGSWSAGDTIPSGMAGVREIEILEVHKTATAPRAATASPRRLRTLPCR